MVEPTFIYSDRSAKLTVLPCVQCGDPVNGFRQCMHCFGHLHRLCGTNAKKGSLRSTDAVCAACAAAKNMDEENMPSQVKTLLTDDSSHPMITTNVDALYGENGEETIPTQDMATTYPELLGGSASTHVSDSTSSDNPPTCIYTSEDRTLRKRLFPCPICGENADGSHQCGVCFRHAHVICASPFPGSTEGFGQQLLCSECHGQFLHGTNNPPPPPQSDDEENFVTDNSTTIKMFVAQNMSFGKDITQLPRSLGTKGAWSICSSHDMTIGLDVIDKSMAYDYDRRSRFTTQKVCNTTTIPYV